MSTKAVIIWLALAVILGGVALALLNVSSVPVASPDLEQGRGLFDFQPTQVEAVRVIRADGREEILERTPAQAMTSDPASAIGADSEWRLRIVPSAGPRLNTPQSASIAPWPVPSAQVQSLLRILADLKSVGTAPKDAVLGAGAKIEFVLKGGSTCTLALAERTLAGTCFATTSCPAPSPSSSAKATSDSPGRALVDAKIHDLFNNPGPLGWREQTFLASFAPQASRIRLENPRQTLALGKIDGRWSLREPVTAPADPGAMQKLLADLARVRIVDFLDSGTADATTGLDSPVARLVIEQDTRSIAPGASEPTVSSTRCTIVVGTAADASAARLFATIDSSRTVLLDSQALANLSMDPVSYLWPHPTRLAPADIGMIVLTRETPNDPGTAFRRNAGKWMRLSAEGAESPLVDKDLAEVEALLTFLTGPSGPTGTSKPNAPGGGDERPVMTIEAPEGYRVAGKISIRSLGGDALENLELGPSAPGSITIRTGSVYRTYPEARIPAILLEHLHNALAAAPAPTVQPPKPVDINK
jgi:hypothetical protein